MCVGGGVGVGCVWVGGGVGGGVGVSGVGLAGGGNGYKTEQKNIYFVNYFFKCIYLLKLNFSIGFKHGSGYV